MLGLVTSIASCCCTRHSRLQVTTHCWLSDADAQAVWNRRLNDGIRTCMVCFRIIRHHHRTTGGGIRSSITR